MSRYGGLGQHALAESGLWYVSVARVWYKTAACDQHQHIAPGIIFLCFTLHHVLLSYRSLMLLMRPKTMSSTWQL